MDFLCIPIICGCQTKISPEGDRTPRICPRCHNAAVISAKSKEYFELCFVPLVPISSKHVWLCSICQWSSPNQPGQWEPQPVTSVPTQPGGYYPAQPPPGFQQAYNPQQHYQPGPNVYQGQPYNGQYGLPQGQQPHGQQHPQYQKPS